MSTFRETIAFFDKLGVYDVVLPFLLIFTIVFAMLEKTKILGLEEGKYTKKNLNSLAAFVIAFFVVASTEMVRIISQAIADIVLLLLLSTGFLLLAGSFHQETDKSFFLEGNWKKFFMIVMVIGIFLIFLNALGWLQMAYDFIQYHWDGAVFGSIVMLIVVVGAIFFIQGDVRSKNKEKSSD